MDEAVTDKVGIEQTIVFTEGDNLLSPFLLSLLINDLSLCMQQRHKSVKLILYADDFVLYSGSRAYSWGPNYDQ